MQWIVRPIPSHRDRRKAAASVALLAALIGATSAAGSDSGTIDTTAVDTFMEHQLAHQLGPGAAIAITRGGELLHARGYGVADAEEAATADTQFAIASVSKGFTAVAVMQLVEAGAIDLDMPVDRYLTDFAVDDPRGGRITVRHLLNQTSGLADVAFPHMTLRQPLSIAERVASLRSACLVAEPGALRELEAGAIAIIEGPYGSFSHRRGVRRRQVWIAGGIGVTPFLSMARSLAQHELEALDLYYCVETATEAVFVDELRAIAARHAGFRVCLLSRDEVGFITAARIATEVADLVSRDVFVCGPPAMISSVRAQLIDNGVPAEQIHAEEFSFAKVGG